jgi:predicted ATP-grasp superfamily ATP-dependent carboligase
MPTTAVRVSQPSVHTRSTAPAGAAEPRAIVIGLDCPTGLQTARILARRGVPVIGIARDPRHPCARTNACERVVASDVAGLLLVDTLRHIGRSLEADAVVVPCTDMSVLLTSRHRDELAPWLHVVLPEPDIVEMLVDKARFYAFAQQAGLPLPPTVLLHSRQDAEDAARALRFPVILKPAVKTPEWERHTSIKAYQLASAEEFLRLYDRCAAWTGTLIAQEWIAGGDTDHYTCNAYFGQDGEPLVTLTTRKLRQWPPTGGQACLSVEVEDEAVRDATVQLFRAVRHRGLGYLEMKRDARTGEYLIIEPNIGRPTGRSATAEAAGVELLYTMYCDALGWPLPASRTQTFRGTKWIHLRRDVQSALYHWTRGELTLRDWVGSWRGPMVDALFSWHDPVPFWADLGRTAAAAASRRKARGRTGQAESSAAPVSG